MKIAILGGGSWGSALAVHVAANGHNINVWEFFDEQAREMQEKRVCKLLPEVVLPANIFISSNMGDVLRGSEVVMIVVPSDKVEKTIHNAMPWIDGQPVIICSKGFSADGSLLSAIVKQHAGSEVYCLYGPTHAEEVGKGMFSGIVLAGMGSKRGELQQMLHSGSLKVDVTDDIVGVQVCAALKNVLAVFIGVLD